MFNETLRRNPNRHHEGYPVPMDEHAAPKSHRALRSFSSCTLRSRCPRSSDQSNYGGQTIVEMLLSGCNLH